MPQYTYIPLHIQMQSCKYLCAFDSSHFDILTKSHHRLVFLLWVFVCSLQFPISRGVVPVFRSHISVWFDVFASACGVSAIKGNCFPPMVSSKNRKTSLLGVADVFLHLPLEVFKFIFRLCLSVLIV